MTGPTIEQVDAAVRAVLGGLSGSSAPIIRADVFPGRLLALRHAEELARRGPVVQIAPGTIVTPLARDHLRRQGVEIRLMASGLIHAGGATGEWGFAVESTHGTIEALRRDLLDRSEVWYDLGIGMDSAVRWLVGSDRRGAVLLTDQAALACWRANRSDGLRAATVYDVDGVLRASASLGANLLVVEPTGKTNFELKYLFATYRRAGIPRPPADLDGGSDDAHRRGDRAGHALTFPSVPTQRLSGDRPPLAGLGSAGGLAGAWRGGDRL